MNSLEMRQAIMAGAVFAKKENKVKGGATQKHGRDW